MSNQAGPHPSEREGHDRGDAELTHAAQAGAQLLRRAFTDRQLADGDGVPGEPVEVAAWLRQRLVGALSVTGSAEAFSASLALAAFMHARTCQRSPHCRVMHAVSAAARADRDGDDEQAALVLASALTSASAHTLSCLAVQVAAVIAVVDGHGSAAVVAAVTANLS